LGVLNEPRETLIALPVDVLAMRVLTDAATNEFTSEYNYRLMVNASYPESLDLMNAVAEAFTWLRSRGLVATTPDPQMIFPAFVTRAGRAALKDGLGLVRAAHQLQEGTHPLIEARARRQFLLGEYELAVFSSMKAVEIRVRGLADFGDDKFGVALMNDAFGRQGPLTDHTAERGEQDGLRFLFAGAYATLRNPSGHRDVDYDDVAESAEAVQTASLLMRILDRIEARIA
jgi:uncharacterized protein (TIGR02391 family)